jgi:hypothetical protein
VALPAVAAVAAAMARDRVWARSPAVFINFVLMRVS